MGQMKKNNSERCYDLDIYVDKEKHKQLKINGVKYPNFNPLFHYYVVFLSLCNLN